MGAGGCTGSEGGAGARVHQEVETLVETGCVAQAGYNIDEAIVGAGDVVEMGVQQKLGVQKELGMQKDLGVWLELEMQL